MKKMFVLLAVFVLIAGCVGQAPGQSSTDVSINANVEEGTPILIKDMAFSPAELTVNKGAMVTWTNEDVIPHIVKFADFTSQTLSKNQKFSHTFDTAGTYEYSCAIHPSMTGKIIVK